MYVERAEFCWGGGGSERDRGEKDGKEIAM